MTSSYSLSLAVPVSTVSATPSPRYGISDRRFAERYRSFASERRRILLAALTSCFFFLPPPLVHQSSEMRFLRRVDRVSSGVDQDNGVHAIIRFDLSRFRSSGRRAGESSLSMQPPLAFSTSSALKCVINCRRKSAYRSRTLRRVLNSPGFTCAWCKKFQDCSRRKERESDRAASNDTTHSLFFTC